jgi:uncharacterized protein HemX
MSEDLKKIHDEDTGQEIEYEETEDEAENEIELESPSEQKNQPPIGKRKLYFVWIAAVVLLIAIVAGWYYFFQLNMKKINEEVQNKADVTSEQALQQLKDTYIQAKDMIDKADEGIDKLKETIAASESYEVK